MAEASHAHAAPTNAEICGFFFAPVLVEGASGGSEAPPIAEGDAEAAAGEAAAPAGPQGRRGRRRSETPALSASGRANRHRCRLCGNVYTQNASTGYTNLMTHLRIKHSDWPEHFRTQRLPDAEGSAVASPAEAGPPLPAPVRMVVGRKRGPVYEHYEEQPGDNEDASKVKRLRCVHCRASVPQLSGRLKLHLASGCDAVPETVKADYVQQLSGSLARNAKRQKRAGAEGDDGESSRTLPGLSSPMAFALSLKPSTPVKGAMPANPSTPLVNGTPTNSRSPANGKAHVTIPSTFEDKLTAALVSARVPWSLLDNEYFRDALALLAGDNPRADFPLTAARASTVVIGRLADEYDAKTASSLSNAKFATFIVDRCAVKKKPSGSKAERISIVVSDESRHSFLLASRVRSPEKFNAAKLVSELEGIVRTHSFVENAKLFLCVDAANGSFTQLRKLLNELKNLPAGVVDDDIALTANRYALIGSCMAQQSVLLLRDIIHDAEASSIISDAVAIAKALPLISDFSSPPSTDDWSSVALAVHQISRAEDSVCAAFAKAANALTIANNQQLTKLASVVADKDFWTSLVSVDALLAPLNACATLSEMAMTTSGQFLSLWLWAFAVTMESPLLKNKLRFSERFFDRIEAYVEDHCIVSMVLDPRVRGAGLSSSGLRRARGVAVRVASALLPELDETSFVRSYNDFMKKQGDFGDDGLWNAANTNDPVQFWSDFDGDALHAQLAHVALAVCAFVPSTRSFQSFWSIHEEEDTDAGASDVMAKIRFSLDDGSDTRDQRVRAFASKVGGLLGPHTSALSSPQRNTNGQKISVVAIDAEEIPLKNILGAIHDPMTEDVDGSHNSDAPSRMDASWLDLSSGRSVWI